MLVVKLPMTFTNSFWSQDYRRGLVTLYGKLDEGLVENIEIFNFIKARALAENALASALLKSDSIIPQRSGFGVDDGATLLATFRSLQEESQKQGGGHKATAQELVTLVADPFGTWASNHATRIADSKKDLLDGWIQAYEQAAADVDKLKLAYLNKTRRADEIEDNAKFAPSRDIGDSYTLSPSLTTNRRVAASNRTASVSERIAQRFKELRKGVELQDEGKKGFIPASPVSSAEAEFEAGDSEISRDIPGKDKGKNRGVVSLSPQQTVSPTFKSPPKLSPSLPQLEHHIPDVSMDTSTGLLPPQLVIIAGLAFPPQALSHLLKRAAAELPLRKVRFPILGEYQDCFSGEEFVVWLKDNVQGFGGRLDAAEQAAIELTEREDSLRRIGELGKLFDRNRFLNSRDAYFQFRAKAFEFHLLQDKLYAGGLVSPVTDNLVKHTSTLVNIVQKAVAGNNNESTHVRARNEAYEAEKTYRIAVRRLDRHRLALEEKIEDTLKVLQRWEMERLRMIKTGKWWLNRLSHLLIKSLILVLLQYQGIVVNLPRVLNSSFERSSTAIASFQPETDIIALIERYRTGQFRPCPPLYESITHEQQDTAFGVDLRRWAHENGLGAIKSPEEQKEAEKLDLVPTVVKSLLQGLAEAYTKLPNDLERRKVWIYDVPLLAVHHLREAINTIQPPGTIQMDMLAKYDAPILASTLKLWLLELNPPLCTWDSWDDIKKIYPHVAGSSKDEEQRLQELHAALLKLPKVHLVVLDTIIEHLRILIDTTQAEEPLEMYVTKLGLSLGRCILRPKVETLKSLEERHPTLFFMELINRYNDLLPKVLTAKKHESGPTLLRKRTKMVDQRVSRSKISAGIDPQQLLAAQHAAQHGPSSLISNPVPGHIRFPSSSLPVLQVPPNPNPSDEAKTEQPTGSQAEQEQPKIVEPADFAEPIGDPIASIGDTVEVAKPDNALSPQIVSTPTPRIPIPPLPPIPAAERPESASRPVESEVPLLLPFAVHAEYHPFPRTPFFEELDKPTRQSENQNPLPENVEGVCSPTSARQSPDSTGSGDSSSTDSKNPVKPLSGGTSLRRAGSGGMGVADRVRGARPPSSLRNSSGAGGPSAPTNTRTSPSTRVLSGKSQSPVRRTINVLNRSSTQLSSEQGREYAPRKHVGKASASLFSRRTVASDAEDNILDK